MWWLMQVKVLWWRLKLFKITIMTHLPTPDSQVTSVVTVTSPVTTAKNPVLVPDESDLKVTVMSVPENGPGFGPGVPHSWLQCFLFSGWGEEELPPEM